MKTLIVDDINLVRKILIKVMAGYGKCDTAIDGQQAIDYFELALNEKDPYNLILLDIIMPVIDGIEALRLIREVEDKRAIAIENRVRVVMISSLGNAQKIDEAFKYYCDGYIVKPININKVKSKIEEIFHHSK